MKRKRLLPPPVRLVKQDGRFKIVGMGEWHTYWHDPYHLMLTMPWSWFLTLVTLGYVVANALFAVAYLAGGDGIENARPGNFFDAFFFSFNREEPSTVLKGSDRRNRGQSIW